MMVIDPAFAKKQDLLDGAIEFLQYVRAAFEVKYFNRYAAVSILLFDLILI